jgi:DNA-binding beta-propeller fold protein YncE
LRVRFSLALGAVLGLAALAADAAAPPPPMPRAAWRVVPFAGTGEPGHLDGPKEGARFNWPTDIAVAPDWTVYVADFGNNRLRVISPKGRVSTLAGAGEGYADGTGEDARFSGPNGIALGPHGDIYVADAGNARIRRVTPAGAVTTVAGDGMRGLMDGPGPKARFAYPTGLAFDPAGHLYVVDRWAHCVRTVAPDGTVATLAGNGVPGFVDGPGSEARFDNPLSATWDPEWGLVVTDSGNHALRRVALDGTVSTLVGGPFPRASDGPPEKAGFYWDTGIVSDGRGGLYVSDAQNHKVRRMTRTLFVTTVAGSGRQGVEDGPDRQAEFAFITGITLDPADNLLVADSGANRIRRIVRGGAGLARGVPGWLASARTRSPSGP